MVVSASTASQEVVACSQSPSRAEKRAESVSEIARQVSPASPLWPRREMGGTFTAKRPENSRLTTEHRDFWNTAAPNPVHFCSKTGRLDFYLGASTLRQIDVGFSILPLFLAAPSPFPQRAEPTNSRARARPRPVSTNKRSSRGMHGRQEVRRRR